jgi:uncharacterized protein with PIN domain
MNENRPLSFHPHVPDLPRLLADAMLGKLARWLRLLGFDTRYAQGDDHRIAHLARAGNRVLLTMDRALAARRGLRTVCITDQALDAQVVQVMEAVGAPPSGASPRCMTCNVPLVAVAPEDARERVPAYVARTHDVFNCCPKCGRIYWKGSHWRDMESQYPHIARRLQD